jgi:putative Mg2+ transporter-C (MgtC) family protein
MIPDSEIVLRLLLGALLGGIIGFERQHHGRPAGFRTHLLVCTASVLVMLISEYFHFRQPFDSSYVRVDPGRIAAGAITGIGFLGAGVIVRAGVSVHGLTTAACLWVVSAIGLALGSGLYLAAGLTFVITILTLWLLEKLERLMPSRLYRSFTVVTETAEANEAALRKVMGGHGTTVKNVAYEFNREKRESSYVFTISLRDRGLLGPLLKEVASLPFVLRYSLRT